MNSGIVVNMNFKHEEKVFLGFCWHVALSEAVFHIESLHCPGFVAFRPALGERKTNLGMQCPAGENCLTQVSYNVVPCSFHVISIYKF